jgi:hypothetical protein
MRNRKLFLTAFAIGAAIAPGEAATRAPITPWSVQVNQVEASEIEIAPEFKAAIYENLVAELAKEKQFSAVLRGGDRRAQDRSRLLILKTTIESFHPGSETKRAVTTFAGATKVKVRAQLCTKDGQIVFERVVDGSVRLFGGNLRATHNLARNVTKAVEQAKLPEPGRVSQ